MSIHDEFLSLSVDVRVGAQNRLALQTTSWVALEEIGARPQHDLGRRHAHRLDEGRVRMDRLADILAIGAHLDGHADLTDKVAWPTPTIPPPTIRPVSLEKSNLVMP
ncbi:hypothetical protein JQK88_33440 [Mesorhizobium caraganae]|nr:hypothetical protein [Mesorhizobium caraganae]MBM2716004.1 hypothetical protein [Mesorhizobium caraganae]